MIFRSVCSGIEAATVAWHPLGWRADAFAEIEPFPSALLAHHYPNTPNLGDMTKFKDWPDAAFDLLVGGTPCQSFSVAGLRKGLADPRGNLTLVYLGVVERYRPRWLVWENVPGVLSDQSGAFGAFLGGLAELGYGFAYRVLDAQYIRVDGYARAVPQRRRRVFVVGYLGDWTRAAAVLFERGSLQGHPAPRREAGKNAAPTLSARTKGGGGLGTDFDLDGGVIEAARTWAIQERAVSLNLDAGPQGKGYQPEVAYTLEARNKVQSVAFAPEIARCDATREGSSQDYETTTMVAVDVAPTMRAGGNTTGGDRPYGTDVDTCDSLAVVSVTGDIAHTLKAEGADASEDGTGRGTPLVPVAQGVALRGRDEGATAELTGDVMTSLRCGGGGGDKPHVLSAFRTTGNDGCYETGDVTACLNTASDPNQITLLQNWRVRRLMPVECERLQGFPDGYTQVPYRGKDAADGPRYKALGNSMAVNVMRWIGRRIQMVDDLRTENDKAA